MQHISSKKINTMNQSINYQLFNLYVINKNRTVIYYIHQE